MCPIPVHPGSINSFFQTFTPPILTSLVGRPVPTLEGGVGGFCQSSSLLSSWLLSPPNCTIITGHTSFKAARHCNKLSLLHTCGSLSSSRVPTPCSSSPSLAANEEIQVSRSRFLSPAIHSRFCSPVSFGHCHLLFSG